MNIKTSMIIVLALTIASCGATFTPVVEFHLVEPQAHGIYNQKCYSAEQACADTPFTEKVQASDCAKRAPYVCINPDIALDGESIVDAVAVTDEVAGLPSVRINISGVAADRFTQITTANAGKPLGLLYRTTTPDGETKSTMISITTISGPLGESFEITFQNKKQAEDFAKQLHRD